MTASPPEVLWAQRSHAEDPARNFLFVTVVLPDIVEDSLEYELTPTSMSFRAVAGGPARGSERKEYAFALEFFRRVDPEKSASRLSSRSFDLTLRKADVGLEYWPRLTKDTLKLPWLRTDPSRWVDEEEQESPGELDDDDLIPTGGLGGSALSGSGSAFDGGDIDFQKMLSSMDEDEK